MVKGDQKAKTGESRNEKFYGFTSVEVRAVNPTRMELNKLLGKEDEDDDKPLTYTGQDNDGNDRVRLTFWLYSDSLDKYFVHSFNLTNKERLSKDGNKNQWINNVCTTTWSDSEANLPAWFTKFQDKERNDVGDKVYRKALLGEEELAIFMRAWLGQLNFNSPSANAQFDPKKLLAEDYSELREHIGGVFSKPFVVLLGVRTDENDSTKQYQQVYGKAFLPNGFMEHLKKSFKGSSDYVNKIWKRFETEVKGEYGFTSFFDLIPAQVYDPASDVAAATKTKADITPVNNKY